MESRPVGECKSPSYPTRREVLAGAASFALASFGGGSCVWGETKKGAAVVAPVFEHGTGRGATGCVVISPPVFLSEEEAMQIIREELAKHDVHLEKGKVLQGVRLFPRIVRSDEKHNRYIAEQNYENDPEWREFIKKNPKKEDPFRPRPLELDGIDSQRNIAIEFVSQREYFNMGGTQSIGSVTEYDFADVAKYVTSKVEKESKDQIYFGVFYDPVVEPPEIDYSTDAEYKAAWKKREETGKEESKKLLRQQVQDFAGWLKEKKVTP